MPAARYVGEPPAAAGAIDGGHATEEKIWVEHRWYRC